MSSIIANFLAVLFLCQSIIFTHCANSNLQHQNELLFDLLHSRNDFVLTFRTYKMPNYVGSSHPNDIKVKPILGFGSMFSYIDTYETSSKVVATRGDAGSRPSAQMVEKAETGEEVNSMKKKYDEDQNFIILIITIVVCVVIVITVTVLFLLLKFNTESPDPEKKGDGGTGRPTISEPVVNENKDS
ncbi:hypothetical protein RF11_06695 [Thelohanellus kitauei]|uniref:Uncharacterized protein n=1 Tax=Thelohanellus kitauei TaxID=669202 RepID=A0A0C2JYE4_THEKT|nr:hypothetical protein RF11_06695 [Thelohanellus kitauei]